MANHQSNSVGKRNVSRLGITVGLLACLLLTAGCGGRLIPRDLKNYVAYNLKIERRMIELRQIFRTEITLRVKPMNLYEARKEEEVLIRTCADYFERDNVSDFINDSLLFVIRLDTDPDVNLKWSTVAYDMRLLVINKMTMEKFLDRCKKEENWSEEL